jgi:serine/threonine protein kinase
MEHLVVLSVLPDFSRFILASKKENILFKVRSTWILETNPIDVIKKLSHVTNLHTRFEFWKPMNDLFSQELINFIKQKYKCKKKNYNCFVTNDRGIDLQTIINLKTLTFDFYDMCCFLEYLVQSLQILSNCGISHQDFKPRNIVIDQKEKLMPIIIDFGDCKIETVKNCKDENLHSFYLFVKNAIETQSLISVVSPHAYSTKVTNLLQELEKVNSLEEAKLFLETNK